MRAGDSNQSDKQLQVCYHKRFLGAVLLQVCKQSDMLVYLCFVHCYRNSALYLSIFNCQEKAVST